jgi:transposase-like protein
MLLLALLEVTACHADAINWARTKGLLCRQMSCDQCAGSMVLSPVNEAPDFEVFRCPSCRLKKSIRSKSIFFDSKITIVKALLLLYHFSRNASNSTVMTELEISDKTASLWFRRFRKICMYFFDVVAGGEVIGGPQSIVEIDESMFARRKYNVGRLPVQRWVFGGIERRTDGCYRSFAEFVSDRKEATLLEVIRRRIAPGTTIMSDGWAAYRHLGQHGYQHEVVIHSQNFVSPLNSIVHTQNVENNWKNIKVWMRRRGTNLGEQLHEYLSEYIYKKWFETDVFDNLILHVGMMYSH